MFEATGWNTLPPTHIHTHTHIHSVMPQATQTTSNILCPPPLSTVIRPSVLIDRHVSSSVRSAFARGRERGRVQSCSPKLSRLASLISMWLIGITIRMRIRIPITFRVWISIRIRIPIVIVIVVVIVLSAPKRLAVCYLWQSLSGQIVANTWELEGFRRRIDWKWQWKQQNKNKRRNTVSIRLPWVTQSRLNVQTGKIVG